MHNPSFSPLANILYDGQDSDGTVREAAYQAKVTFGALPARSMDSRTIAILAEASSGFLERLATYRQNAHTLGLDIPVLVVYNSAAPQTASASDWADWIRTSINQLGTVRWVERDAGKIRSLLESCLRESEHRRLQARDRRALGDRNRELRLRIAEMEEGLERIVTERTSYLVDAEKELHARAQATRDLVRFIKELSQTESIEEVLHLITSEVRRFHDVRPPILAAVSPEFGARLHFQQIRAGPHGRSTRGLEKGWGSKAVRELWPARIGVRVGDAGDQAYLAAQLGRPVARTVSVPLAPRPSQHSLPHGGPLLIFEHDLDEKNLEKFKTFLISRIESLTATLDRVILNSERLTASRLWESTFDGIADPVAVIGREFQILRMNAAFARAHSGREQLCYRVFAGRDTPCEGCRLPEVAAQARSQSWHVRRKLERQERTYAVNGYPIRLNDSDERGVEAVIHHYVDATRALELKGHAIQGEKMAAVGLMAGNIAHELNNPLTGLRSLAQVLAKDPRYPASVIQDLNQIESAAERSSAIIRDLMEFSRSDVKAREVVSLNDVTERALTMLKTATYDSVVETKWAPNSEVMVEVEPHLLQHVIFNIVNNACQVMKSGGELTIATSSQAGRAVIEISDNGPGMPADVLARVFEPFFTTKEAGQGTGLGLSVSRWIVESFGGTIEAHNRSDSGETQTGARFRVALPRAVKRGEP